MYDIQSIKRSVSCISFLQSQGIILSSTNRCISPLRPGAKNPTSFYAKEDFWYDFGSGEGGDVIDLCALMLFKGDKGKAITHLAQSIGLKSERSDNYQRWRDDIQALCNRAAYYNKQLTQLDYDYLEARGISREDADRLLIGRVTDGNNKGRLFLPYFKNGAVVYYCTRYMDGGAYPDSKYKKASRSESQFYENIPWGLHTLNRNQDTLIISEGYFDALSWEVNGYSVISPITGLFSAEQWQTVLQACKAFKNVLIIFDNDDISHAGDKFTARTAAMLYKHHIPFSISHTPRGVKDVNEYYANGGSLDRLVQQAQDGLLYLALNTEDIDGFINEVKRFVSKSALGAIFDNPRFQSKYSPQQIKGLERESRNAPTESTIANEIIREHQIIYIDQVGFYEWTGKVWQKISDGIVRNYADQTYGNFFSTAQRTSSVTNLIKARRIMDVQFDRNPVLSFQNGTLDISTGKFRNHSPLDYCSIIMDYDYDAKRRCPEWEKFITDVTFDDPIRQEILQFIAGYVLFPNCKHQKVFILVGNGGNGKSVYLEIIQKLFGDRNVTHVEPTGLTQEFQRIRLKDSLLNIGADINSDFSRGEIREWLLKIADGTSIQACYKGMTHIDFIPRCKLIYACNAIPTAELVNGLNRRLQFVDFPMRYVEFPDPENPYERKRDINLVPKLLTELPGIFNWRYHGYNSLDQFGYFSDAPEQTELLKQFEQNSNPVSVFCDDTVFPEFQSREGVYNSYRAWCEDTGHKPLSRERFMPRFREAMGDRIIGETRRRSGANRTWEFQFVVMDENNP